MSILITCLFSLPSVSGQPANTNSWLKPTSGSWEEQAHWSLGVLPDATQSVFFTNAGWKALAIGAATAQNFPQSMTVHSLTVRSPVDSRNTLLLNWSGLERPLRTTSLVVGSNSAVVAHGSALEVTGNLILDGSFIHTDSSRVNAHGVLDVSRDRQFASELLTPAAYYLTNGTLTVHGLQHIGGLGPGQFVQHGGSNNAGGIALHTEGEFYLHGGHTTASNGVTVGSGDFAHLASFFQHGGTLNADTFVNGNYVLHGGTVRGRMSAPSGLEFHRVNPFLLQTGGTNRAVSLNLGEPNRFGGWPTYVLSNGVVQVDSSVALRGRFFQYNGLHSIVSNLVMDSTDVGPGLAPAEYFLSSGTFSASGIAAQGATFQQEGGASSVAGDLALTSLPLSGGRPAPPSHYRLSGGSLSARNISLSNGSIFHHTGGVINHSNLLTLAGGHWQARPGQQALGRMRLADGSNDFVDSSIEFPASPSILRLANSSGEAWSSTANLLIDNWRGANTGGGETQLYFGSDASGLASQQLARIKFNISGALHPARILATGEVVPGQRPVMNVTRSSDHMVISWSGNYQLFSSTNVAGPFTPVSGASSPFTVRFDDPQRFFYLCSP